MSRDSKSGRTKVSTASVLSKSAHKFVLVYEAVEVQSSYNSNGDEVAKVKSESQNPKTVEETHGLMSY